MDLEQQLRAALSPCEPGLEPETAVIARISAAAWRASRGTQRKPSRRILFGVILVVAAAAASLSLQLKDTSVAKPVASTPTPASPPAIAPQVADAPQPDLPTPAPVPQPLNDPPATHETPPAIKSFTVRMLPLQNSATGDASKAVELYYATLTAGLRAVPGLTLLEPDSATSSENTPADYRLTIMGSGPLQGDKFSVTVAEGVFASSNGTSDIQAGARSVTNATGAIGPDCVMPPAQSADPTPCAGPVQIADTMLERLLTGTLLPNPSKGQQLQTQLLESSQGSQQHLDTMEQYKALAELHSRPRVRSAEQHAQYIKWREEVEPGSPLERLVDEAYTNNSLDIEGYASRIMKLYEEMLTSAADPQHGPTLEAQIDQALQALPSKVTAGLSIWPSRCSLTKCVVQLSESRGANGTAGAIMSTLIQLAGPEDIAKRHFSKVSGAHRTGDTYYFLQRRDASTADPGK